MGVGYINSKWSMGRRLALISAIFFVPSMIQFAFHINELSRRGSVIETEIAGADLAKSVWLVMGGRVNDAQPIVEAAGQFGLTDETRRLASVQTEVERTSQGVALLGRIADAAGLYTDSFDDTAHASDLFLERLSQIKLNMARLNELLGAPQVTNQQIAAAFGAVQAAVVNNKEPLQRTYALDPSNDARLALAPIEAALDAEIVALASMAASEDAATPKTLDRLRASLARASALVVDASQKSVSTFDRLAAAHLSTANGVLYLTIAILLAVTAAACAFVTMLSRSFSSRLSNLVHVMDRVSHNDVSVEVPYLADTNENGLIASAVGRFKQAAIASLKAMDDAVESAKQQQEMSEHYAREHEHFMGAFTAAAERIARGDFSHRITGKIIQEYEPITNQMNLMMGRLETADTQKAAAQKEIQRVVDSLGEALAKLADGNLEAMVEIDVAPEFEMLKSDFNSAISQLKSTIDLVKKGTASIKLGTDEISQASDDLARRTETQAASLEQTAAAVKEITETVGKTARDADHARETVSVAKSDAEKSGEVVRRAISAMHGIETSSKQISQIISVIDEIAFQTNLLALNAGVEAARAGDAGRGFAVVASEVRALAQRSAEAAKEIKGLISASTGQVTQGVQLVAETGQALGRIVTQVAEINAVVTSIAASANDQAHGLDQVNTAVNEMDQVTQQNAAMVEEATAATQTLARQTDDLARLVSRFSTGNDNVTDVAVRRDIKKSNVRPARPKQAASAGVGRMRAQVKSAEGNWEEF